MTKYHSPCPIREQKRRRRARYHALHQGIRREQLRAADHAYRDMQEHQFQPVEYQHYFHQKRGHDLPGVFTERAHEKGERNARKNRQDHSGDR